jgi:hypothetical protein
LPEENDRYPTWGETLWRSRAKRQGRAFPGTALAITISWSANKSILWAMIHGVFSWFYVIYFALTRQA